MRRVRGTDRFSLRSAPAQALRHQRLHRVGLRVHATIGGALILAASALAGSSHNEPVLLSKREFAAGSAATYRLPSDRPEAVSEYLIHYRLVAGGAAGAEAALERIGELLKGARASVRRLGEAERGGLLFSVTEENAAPGIGVLWIEQDSGVVHVVQVVLTRATDETLDSFETRALTWRDRLATLPP